MIVRVMVMVIVMVMVMDFGFWVLGFDAPTRGGDHRACIKYFTDLRCVSRDFAALWVSEGLGFRGLRGFGFRVSGFRRGFTWIYFVSWAFRYFEEFPRSFRKIS
ncbi:hypothetical protein BZA77DRAFT_102091 [Pyronema omphalodes]|nr:hypothetical protein BZA77DRAFT_102091 [Pyronema omphalodes]